MSANSRAPLCTQCGYALTGSASGRCPECGHQSRMRERWREGELHLEGPLVVMPVFVRAMVACALMCVGVLMCASDPDSIRQVIDAERSIVRPALSLLNIPHESISYEALVADPAAHATRCLDRLGLPMDNAVLAPEQNPRAVYTLSHAQVRRPINTASIGRWRNYAWAFE